MVKLIRMTTNDPNGLFATEFTSDINIEKGSKIALANLTLEGSETEIQINNTNNKISIEYDNFTTTETEIDDGVFKQSQLPALLENIETNLNITTPNLPIGRGQQFKVSVSNGKKVQIEKRQSLMSEYTSNWILENAVRTPVATGNAYSSSLDTNTEANTNAIFTDTEWCKGGAVFTCRIADLIFDESISGNSNGFTFGLTRIAGSVLSPIDTSNIDFGIRVFGKDRPYGYYLGGELELSEVVTNTTDNNNIFQNDILEISISEGLLNLLVYSFEEPDNPTILHQVVLKGAVGTPLTDLKLFPFISFQGKKTNASVIQVRYTPDPFLTKTVLEIDRTPVNDNTVRIIPQQTEATEQSMTFGGLSLANFLGYANVRQPPSGTILTKNIIYTADSLFVLKNVSDSIVVELTDINLSSYESITKNRRNILAVIPAQTNFTDGKVIYEASNLIYLDIENFNKTQFRNIRARLLKGDLSPVSTTGSIIMTLLIKGANE